MTEHLDRVETKEALASLWQGNKALLQTLSLTDQALIVQLKDRAKKRLGL